VIELIIFSLLGILLGIVLGLIPGMHINNILPMILAFPFITDPLTLSVFIISIAVAQQFVGYIPSIFLGAPEEETALSVLPGHKMLLEGKGFDAIKLTLLGGLFSLFVSLGFILLLSTFFPTLYNLSRPYIHYVLIFVIFGMIISERNLKAVIFSFVIVCISGLFGTIVLNSTIISSKIVLFPMLAGLFGLSNLVVSISQKSKIPKQDESSEFKVPFKTVLKSVLLGSLAGITVGFLPAVGVSQAATIMQYVGNMKEASSFLMTISSINISNEIFSLISLYLVGNPRSGASVAIERVMESITLSEVLIFIGSICFAAAISAIFTMYLGKIIPRFLARLNYKILSCSVIIFMLTMIFLLAGLNGILVGLTATAIGVFCNNLGIRRSHLMGCLLIPSVIFFAGLNPQIISILNI